MQRDEMKYELIGHSARLRQVLRLADKLGRGNWPVLLLGETGTGKELVARTVHQASAGGEFVVIDVTTIQPTLMESELFGHVKGSFTSASSNKVGLIERADGGTAFFDEIGELPLDMQSRLLRVLQEKTFRPVGAHQEKRSDFRIIAATNRDLAKEVERGAFRRDLYYRLNVVTLRLAPLRERKDDIPALVSHFLRRYGSQQTLSGEVLEVMLAYHWPGNIRELENCIQHMVAVNSGPVIHQADLPSNLLNFAEQRHAEHSDEPVRMTRAAAAGMTMSAGNGGLGGIPYFEAPGNAEMPVLPLMELEKRAIRHALLYTKGDRATAAQLLGIGRTTLYRKLKEFGIEG